MVPADRDTAWELVMDLPRVAPCVPGLSGLESDGEGRYTGMLQAQAGPMRVNLAGSVRVVSQDAAQGRAELPAGGGRPAPGRVGQDQYDVAANHDRRRDRRN